MGGIMCSKCGQQITSKTSKKCCYHRYYIDNDFISKCRDCNTKDGECNHCYVKYDFWDFITCKVDTYTKI